MACGNGNCCPLNLYRRVKPLFKQSRLSPGSKEITKKSYEEGFSLGWYQVCTVMNRLGLKVTQRLAKRVTTKRKQNDAVADNLLNHNFIPVVPNQVWAGDVTYLKTFEDGMYQAIIMDLYSRRIASWRVDRRMTADLVSKAVMKVYNLRQPGRILTLHSDKGSQYTSKKYRKLLLEYCIRVSMGDIVACWNNAAVKSLFGSLKHDWLFTVYQPTREQMQKDVAAYMRHYNLESCIRQTVISRLLTI